MFRQFVFPLFIFDLIHRYLYLNQVVSAPNRVSWFGGLLNTAVTIPITDQCQSGIDPKLWRYKAMLRWDSNVKWQCINKAMPRVPMKVAVSVTVSPMSLRHTLYARHHDIRFQCSVTDNIRQTNSPDIAIIWKLFGGGTRRMTFYQRDNPYVMLQRGRPPFEMNLLSDDPEQECTLTFQVRVHKDGDGANQFTVFCCVNDGLWWPFRSIKESLSEWKFQFTARGLKTIRNFRIVEC